MSKKKVIYSYISENESRHIVNYLNRKYQWRPVVFHGYSSMRRWVEEDFPKAKLIDSLRIRQGKFDYSLIDKILPIDSEIIENLSPYESNYLSWLQDTTGWNFSYAERLRYYYDVLKYWNSIINEVKPDIFISYTWPHVPSDFALYLLCKYHFKIPVLFIDITPQLDNNYFTIGCDLENLSAPFEQYYHGLGENISLAEDVSVYLEKLRSNTPRMPKHVEEYFSFLDNKKKRYILKIVKLVAGLFTGSAYNRNQTFKKNKKPWGSKNSLLTAFEEFFFWRELSKKNKFLRDIYRKYAVKPRQDTKYIYFAAPYQPEAISNINQGCYEDPFLIIDILISVLPPGHIIYYKEHPNVFKDADKGALYRSKQYYDKLNSYEFVQMIPVDCNTFELIDSSLCVATVGGTVGWEAVVRGKPALTFGSIWYQGCKSVFTITNLKSAKDAMHEILDGFIPDPHDINKYAQAIYESSEKDVVSVTGYAKKIRKAQDPLLEMERIAEMFYKAEKKFYQRK